MSFMTHRLKFRKDVTAIKQQMDDYITLDPRAENYTLEDGQSALTSHESADSVVAKHEEDRRRRKGLLPTTERKEHTEPRRERGGVRSRGYEKNAGAVKDWRGQKLE
jgi:hypothetical protein